jgi:integrase/recombinase XerD
VLTQSSGFEAFRTLRACLSWAVVDLGLLPFNPATKLKISIHRAPARPMTQAEIVRFWPELARCEEERVSLLSRWAASPRGKSRQLRPYVELVRGTFAAIRFFLLTGCRIGEAIKALIAQVVVDGGEVGIVWPRFKGQRRVVQCGPQAQKVLFEQIERAKAAGSRFIFPSSVDVDSHVTRHYVWETHRTVCERVGIKGVTPHDHRHRVATRLFKKRVPELVISRVLGHVNPHSLRSYLDGTASPLAEDAIRLYEHELESIVGG